MMCFQLFEIFNEYNCYNGYGCKINDDKKIFFLLYKIFLILFVFLE